MNTASLPSAASAQSPVPPLETFLFVIRSPVRWAILSELSAGQPLLVLELAERLKERPNVISKHMLVLRKAGFVSANRARQYSLAPQFPVTPEERVLDFGHALLRLGVAGK